MTLKIQNKWDNIYAEVDVYQAQAASVLSEQAFLLPKKGRALDLACGLGANALLLAKQGLETQALDISPVALKKLQQQALLQGLNIDCKQLDIEATSLTKHSFDVIVVSRFLDRSFCHGIIGALKLGGLLFYQTFTQDKLNKTPPNNPAYLLAENELLSLFSELKTLYYQEHALVGCLDEGNRNEALFIGQKIVETI